MQAVNLAMLGGAPTELILATRDEKGREAVYTRVFLPPQRLILLGGGHVSQPLCRYAADLGFDVVVVDDRPGFANAVRFPDAGRVICDSFDHALEALAVTKYDFVGVITRGHRHDALCLRVLLAGTQPRYLGLIGSRRRTIALFQMLEEEGFDRARIDQIHTPIGLAIGAETPKEIAISILAELILQRSSKSGAREAERLALTSHEPELLAYLLSGKEPFALAVVVGFYVITAVTHALHTPLMSVTNAISGIIVVGALTQINSDSIIVTILAVIATTVASINIFGGFTVTHRMLKMFQRS